MRTRKPGTRGAWLAAAASWFFAASASGGNAADLDRFRLWNDCRAMNLVIEGLPAGGAAIGLTNEAVAAAVRSKLRAARLYEAGEDPYLPYLYVQVNVFETAFGVRVEYRKVVADVASDQIGFGATWRVGRLGTHGWDPAFVLSGVSQSMDEFIDEYLRVNADACARR